ncbi:glycosyltransferase family 4 protein [Cryobacterium sp. SO2]|uniref:glycosyltransferase family 4 protein n=1 Tax=Cryobacterium sp. SO2 TaxID=1897060 RepID=UPI00223DC754|nr:glycosyltransferase family 4 protein [Cryobacterium sp. SO2]WEO76933.1 glycosyltransferase family 4 protein [Cryobacterium sp. SO2]
MRIVVYPHSLEVGGSQRNAIDLATSLSQRGHEVLVFGQPGPLQALVRERGLPLMLAPRPRIRPSPAVMRRLSAAVDGLGADIVHAFEWPPAAEAVFGPYLRSDVPVVCSIMSMSVAPFLPAWLPLTVGTQRLLRAESRRRPRVSLLEPPVDTAHDRPTDTCAAKQSLGISVDTIVISLVGRLAVELKREGILAAIAAIGVLAVEYRILLVIAGDGPIRREVDLAAEMVNAAAGTEVVRVTGYVSDPRPVYAAGDIALAMGGSALRAMAFGKPLVVQGESGFWRVLEPDSIGEFTENGWFGIGDGGDGTGRLVRLLRPLLASAADRARLGEFSRRIVTERYGLSGATDRVESLYRQTISHNREQPLGKSRLLHPYLSVIRYEMTRKVMRRLHGVPTDDFNSLQSMQTQHEQEPAP